MKKLSVIFSLLCFPFIAQMNEAEVKEMIKSTEEAQLVGECSRFLQENFYHFADLVTDKLLTFQPKNQVALANMRPIGRQYRLLQQWSGSFVQTLPLAQQGHRQAG